MFKKLSTVLFLLFILPLAFSGCIFSTGADENVEELPQTTLRVSYSEWPPDLMVYLADELGLFADYNVDVELVKVSGFEELFEKIENSEIDIWGATLLDALIAFSEGEDWQVIMLEDFSAGADAVVTLPQNEILSVSDLEGKRVGVEQGTVGEFFLQILLTRENLLLEDVEIVNLAYDEIPSALENGDIVAGVTYEPSISEVLEAGGEVLVDSEKERGAIVDVYVGHEASISQYANDYKHFSEAILEASDFFRDNPEEAIEIMKVPFDTPPEELLAAFDGLRIPTLRDNKTAFNRTSGHASLYALALQAQIYLENAELISAPGNLADLFAEVIDMIK